MTVSVATLVLVPLIAVVAAVLTHFARPVLRVPLVVFEIVLGLLLGPAVLDWVHNDDLLQVLSNFGLAFLFFMAGNEIDFLNLRSRSLVRAIAGWLVSLVAGVGIAIALTSSVVAGVFIGIALTSTALGTIVPVLRDAGDLRSPFGLAVLAVGAAGEFGPLIAMSLFLSGRSPAKAGFLLAAFSLLAVGVMVFATRAKKVHLHRVVTATLHTSEQFAVRVVILLLAGLVALSMVLGLDILLGAFAAGIVARLLLSEASPDDAKMVEAKLEAVGFGFLIPVFFISTGVTFDLHALLGSTRSLVLLPIFLLLLLLLRGPPGMFAAPRGAPWSDRRAIALFSATGLPIIVAVATLGVARNELSTSTAAALIGAGMLSVLLYPLLALQQRSAHGG